MATEIDKRVVEMQFDNKDFEKNCQASLSTLEKLKMALNFDGAKGLDSMAKAASKIDMSGLAKGAEAVEVRFNAMNVAGMTAISELTKGFIGLGKRIWDLSFGQMKSGGMARTLKIEQANFQMKALAENMDVVKNKTKSVTQVVKEMGDAASRAVDGTAYGLDAASAVASQLMASGLSDADKMYDHLRAIAGAAAMTGRSYEDIGNIFTTVASNGRLMTMQLRQFSAAGLNLSATLAKSEKYAGKTEEQINEMVTKGKISFEDFSDALGQAFSDAAGRADDTFSGVTSNVKAQLSRVGQLFTDPFVKHMIPLLKEVKASIKNIRDALAPIGQTFDKVFGHFTRKFTEGLHNLELSRLRKVFNGIENILGSIILTLNAIGQAFKEVFPDKTLDELRDAAAKFEEMTRKIIPTTETLNGLKEVIKALLIPVRLAFNLFKTLWQSVVLPLAGALLRLLGAFLRLGNALAPVVDAIIDILTSSEFLNSVFTILAATIIVVLDAVTQLTLAFGIILGKIVSSTTFMSLINMLHDIAHIISVLIVNGLTIVFKIIQKIFSFIKVDNILKIVDAITAAFGFIISFVGLAITTIANIIDGIANSGTILGKIFNLFREIFGLLKDVFSGNDTSDRLNNIRGLIDGIKDSIVDLFSKLKEYLKGINAGQILVFAFGVAIIFLTVAVTKFVDAMTGLTNAATGAFGILDGIKKAIKNIGNYTPIFQMFLGLALAIGAITSALITLSRDTDPERLKLAAIVLGSFVVAITGLAVAIAWFSTRVKGEANKDFMKNFALTVLGIAASVMLLALGVKLLASTNASLDQLKDPLIAVIALIGALTSSAILMGRFGKEGAKGTVAIIAFSLSISMLVKTLIKLMEIDLTNVKQTLLSLIAIITLMITLASSMALMAISGVRLSTGFALMGFVVSLLALVALMKSLAKFDYDSMRIAFLRMLMIMTPLIAFLVLATIAVKISKANDLMGQLAAMLMAFNLALVIMAVSTGILGGMDFWTLVKGIGSLALLATVLAETTRKMMEAMQVTRGIDYKLVVGEMRQMVNFMKALGLAMLLISASAVVMSKSTIQGVIYTAAILYVIRDMLEAIIPTLKDTKDAKVGPIIALISAIAMIMASLAILSFQDPAHILAAGVAIGMALGTLSFVLEQVNAAPKVDKKTADEIKESKRGTAIIAAAIGGIVFALASLTIISKYISPEQIPVLNTVLTALAGLLLTVFIFVAAAARIDNKNFASNADSIAKVIGYICGALVSIALTLAGMMFVMSMTKGWGIAGLIGSVISLGLIMEAIIRVVTELQQIKEYKNAESLEEIAKRFLIMCSSIAIIAGSLAILSVISAIGGFSGIAGMVIGTIAIIALMNAMTAMFKRIIEMSKDVSDTDLKNIATSTVIMASTMAIIAGSLSVLMASIALGKWGAAGGLILGVIALGLLMNAIVATFKHLVDISNDLKEGELRDIAISAVIMASTMAIIAGSIILLSSAMIFTGFGRVMGSVLAISLCFAELVGAFIVIAYFTKKLEPNQITDVKQIILMLASMYVLIAGSLAVLALIPITDKEAFESKVNALIKVMGMITKFAMAMVGAIMIFEFVNKKFLEGQGKIDTKLLWTIASMVAILSASLSMIALSMAVMINSVANVDEKKLVQAAKILGIFFGAITLIVALAGVIAGFTQVGNAVVLAMLGFAAAVAIFSLAGLLIAKTIDIVVDAIIKLNSAKIDSNVLGENISNAAEGIAKAMPSIVHAIESIMDAIIQLLADIVKYSVELGAAAALGFLQGINESLPEMLKTFKEIMQKIVDFLNNDENRNLIKTFAESIGEIIYDVISSILQGLFHEINEAIDHYVDRKMELQRDEAHKEENTNLQQGLSKNISERYFGDEQYLTLLSAARDRYESDRFHYAEEYLGYLNDFESKLSSMSDSDISEMIEAFNNIAFQSKQAGNEIDSGILKNIKLMATKLPEEYKDKIDPVFLGIKESVEEVGDTVKEETKEVEASISETNTKTIENIKLGSENAKNEFMTLTKDLLPDLNKSLESGAEGVKGFFTDLFSSIGVSSGLSFDTSMLGSIDFEKITAGLKDGSFDMGDILGSISGMAAGDAYAKYFAKTVDDYYAEGGEQVSAFDAKAGKQVSVPKWQTTTNDEGQLVVTDKYKDRQAWANAQYDAEQEASAMNKILTDQLNILEEVDEQVEDNTESLTNYGDSTGEVNKKFKDFYTNLRDSIKNGLNIFDEVSEQEEISSEEMLDRMWENTRRVGQWARQISELAARGMSEGLLNELKDLGPQGAAKVDAFARMTQEQLMEANRLYSDAAVMPDAASREIIQSYKDAGYDASLGFVQGIDTEIAKVKMEEMGEEGLDGLKTSLDSHSPSRETMKIGEFATEGFTIGMTDAKSQGLINKATKIVAALLMNGLRNDINPNKLRIVGENCMDGLVAGFNYKLPSTISRIQAIATQILSRFAQIFKINSPSKVFEEFGEMTMLGFSNGMDEGQSDVVSTTDKTANDILDAMKANIASITDGWSEDSAYEPVIRPVFDMSSISQGYSDIQTWFANAQGLNLNGNLSRLTPTTREDDTNTNQMLIDAINNLNNDDVVDELVALRNDISNLQSAMTNLQVVMNTGALVGQIIEPVDNALGAKALRNQRGRY